MALDNGDEIQRISKSPRPCKYPSQYRIAVSCACSPILGERMLAKRERQREMHRKKEKEGQRWETETFKVFQRITRKSYHRKRISPRFFSPAKSAVVARAKFWATIGNLFVLIGHSYCLNFVWATREGRDGFSFTREGRLSSRKITSLCVVRVDVYGERNNARAHTGRSLSRSDNELVPVYVFTARKLPRPLANFPFKINANGDEAKRELVY